MVLVEVGPVEAIGPGRQPDRGRLAGQRGAASRTRRSAPPVSYPNTVLADSPSVYYRLGETSGTVAKVFSRGYTIGPRLLRPAMVAVAKQPDKHEQSGDGESETKA